MLDVPTPAVTLARAHELLSPRAQACLAALPAEPASAHRAATSLGQSVAPVALCFHPAFPWPQGHATPKATIAWAVPPGVEVVARVIGALNRAERNAQGEPLRPGEWGGNAMSGIIGSPQGRASALTEEQIVEIVRVAA